MSCVTRVLQRLAYSEDGQDLAEYAILVILIAIGAMAGIGLFGTELRDYWTNAVSALGALL